MPTYEYECEACGIHFDRLQPFSAEPLKECPECEGPVHRVLSPPAIVYKGSGFYRTDYAGAQPAPAKKEKSDSKSSEAESESAKKQVADSPGKKKH